MEMKYDYRGRRVEQTYSRTVNGEMTAQWTRRYLYDGFQLIAEIDASDGVQIPPIEIGSIRMSLDYDRH